MSTCCQIKGKTVPVKIWSSLETVESAALAQLRNIASLPWVFHHVAAMADVHLGVGATVGSVVATKDAISPAAVGVDIGCVDLETEFLSRDGWKKISEWNGEEVLQYHPEDGRATFEEPLRYLKFPCDSFVRIHTKYGVDQKLSPEHTVLYLRYDRSYTFQKRATITAAALMQQHSILENGFRGRFITTFRACPGTRVEWSDTQLRVIVMVAADGHFVSKSGNKCRLRLKKLRKIERARILLDKAGIPFEQAPADDDGVVNIRFLAPVRLKTLNLWKASQNQLAVIASEVYHWDGNEEDSCFYTRDKQSADFISYAFAATGSRSVLRSDVHPKDGKLDYRVFAQPNLIVGINGTPKTPITTEPSADGFKYCFTTTTGFWVMRRNGIIAVTGNRPRTGPAAG